MCLIRMFNFRYNWTNLQTTRLLLIWICWFHLFCKFLNYFFTLDKGILKYNNIDTTSSLYKQVYLTIFMICPFYLSSCLGPGGCKNIAIHTCHTAFLRNSTLLLGTDGQCFLQVIGWYWEEFWTFLQNTVDPVILQELYTCIYIFAFYIKNIKFLI